MFTLYRHEYEHLSDMWLSALEIGAAQLRSVTEIAPKSLFLCVNTSPTRCGFRASVKTIRYSLPQFSLINPRTYILSHTPTVVQGGLRKPLPWVLLCCSISKRFYLQLKAFDLLDKMRYILWVLTLLEACDVTKHGRHLGFCQELEFR